MIKKNFIVVMILFLISCSSNIKKIIISQENSLPIDITFYVKDSIKRGTLILRGKIIIQNPNSHKMDINFHYFRNGDTIFFPNQAILATITDENYFKQTGVINRIRLKPFEKEEISYFVWNTIDSINLMRSQNLKEYISQAKPFKEYDKIFKVYREDKNILTYEEPFSEFKRKNPELLEFLTKGDSIELEVISPVKQKYKFKAEW